MLGTVLTWAPVSLLSLAPQPRGVFWESLPHCLQGEAVPGGAPKPSWVTREQPPWGQEQPLGMEEAAVATLPGIVRK